MDINQTNENTEVAVFEERIGDLDSISNSQTFNVSADPFMLVCHPAG